MRVIEVVGIGIVGGYWSCVGEKRRELTQHESRGEKVCW